MRMKRRMYPLLIVAMIMGFFFVSCLKEPNYAELEQSNIDEFINNNPDVPFIKKESGLYYHEVTAGTGEVIREHDTAKVIYAGKFLSGAVFDTNVDRDTLSFQVGENNMIPGFVEGISYMKQGGTAVLLIPSSLAYGAYGKYPIPGYTPILFDVKLARIVRVP